MEENLEIANVFAEIHEIFKYTSEEVINRIPKKLLKIIEEKRNRDYDFKCDLTVGLQEQRIMPETKDFIAVIFMNYCCDDENERRTLVRIVNENENKRQDRLNDMWNNNENIQSEEITQALAIVEERGFFRRMISKIKSMFKVGRRQAQKNIMQRTV